MTAPAPSQSLVRQGFRAHRREWPRPRLLLALAAGLALAGCRQFDQHREELASLHAAGRYEKIANLLDRDETKRLYGARNEVLWALERGAAALAVDDTPTTVRLLESAERTIEVQRERSLADVLGQWLVNDRSAKYIAEPYEDMYVNVLKLLAQLEAGHIIGGATVEARRLASKADVLRDLHLRYEEALRRESPALGPRASLGANLDATNPQGRFIESPLGTFLTAVTFMEAGERELQRVAARRLLDSIRLQGPLLGPVRAEDFAGLGDLQPDEADLLVVALSGRGPTKHAVRHGPFPLGTLPIYFELPHLLIHRSRIDGARVEVEGRPPASMALVEDLSSVAAANHRRMLPLIEARTLARYALKAGLSVAATEIGRRRASDEDQGLVQVLGVLAGLAFLGATEKADIRAWSMLPGQARVAVLDLPPGEHRVRVVYTSAGRPVHATDWKTLSTGASPLVTIVTHHPG